MKNFPPEDIPRLVRRFQALKGLAPYADKPDKAEAVKIALATAVTELATVIREWKLCLPCY